MGLKGGPCCKRPGERLEYFMDLSLYGLILQATDLYIPNSAGFIPENRYTY